MPILGPKMLKRDFLDPGAIAAGHKMVLNQLPKRRLPGELRAVPGSTERGWGLYIEENRVCPSLIQFCVFISVLAFVVFILTTILSFTMGATVRYR